MKYIFFPVLMEGVGITSINKNAWRGVVSGLVMMGNSGALIEQRDTTYLQDTTLRVERIRRWEKKGRGSGFRY